MSESESESAPLSADAADDSPSFDLPTDSDFKKAFVAWLGGLGGEARELSALLAREDATPSLRRFAAETLNQLLYAVDLIPEGIEGLGFLEALFGFRLRARELSEAEPDSLSADPHGTVRRLAREAGLVRSFLGEEDERRLLALVSAQSEKRARGRSVVDLLEVPEAQSAAIADVQSWAERYRPSQFGTGSHDLVRLLS
ncbi:MAG TPA: hypothetical protein VG963_13770, partial [Polyangiaceae bacterium]|nr:hypothetical protein [Polyangiaceae bacterium]